MSTDGEMSDLEGGLAASFIAWDHLRNHLAVSGHLDKVQLLDDLRHIAKSLEPGLTKKMLLFLADENYCRSLITGIEEPSPKDSRPAWFKGLVPGGREDT